jgi:piezo-type mechanosensitive ion channel component 1/2
VKLIHSIDVTIVLAVGRFLRMSVSDMQYNIIFEDLPEPMDLITVCEDIFMAREDHDMRLERDLYNELIQLYRSPETLIAVTKRKVPPPPGYGTSI